MNSGSIDVRSWRQFVAVAERLHFGRAAEQLGMTQPPLTMAIQQLERKLGVRLFDRSRRSVALTSAGAALLSPVREWLAQGEALSARAHAAGKGDVGRLRLGFVSTLGFGPLPGWLRGFRERYPGIEIALREATTDVQCEAFARGELDAGFMLHAGGIAAEVEARGFMTLRVAEEPLVLALAETHALAAGPRLAPAALPALLAEPLVIFPRAVAPSLFDAVLAFYHRQAAVPVIAQEAIQMQTIVNLVSAGLGFAWVPQVVTQLQRPGVAYRSLPRSSAAAVPRCQTSLVWQRAAPPAAERFVEFVRTSLRDLPSRRAT